MIRAQTEVAKYLAARGWDKLAPADLAKSIMIEGAELLELFQWHNHTTDEIANDQELKEKIQKEMADVMIYCTELAIHLDIDIELAILAKLEHNDRKYPAEEVLKHTNEPAKASFYMQRKMEYRKAGR